MNKRIKFGFLLFYLLFSWVLFISPSTTQAISAEEHASHHPGAAAQPMGPEGAAKGGGMGGGMGGGAGGGMGEMMKEMGAPKRKGFYPSLMTLPKLTSESRAQLESSAVERMKTGASIMNQALVDLTKAAEGNDYSQMKTASRNLAEGLAEFESGITTHEALAEGQSPQVIGLAWFKKNLALEDSRESVSNDRTFFGLNLFHLFVMALLTTFSLVMVGMYFFKMKRATELLSRLNPGVKTDSKAAANLASGVAGAALAKPAVKATGETVSVEGKKTAATGLATAIPPVSTAGDAVKPADLATPPAAKSGAPIAAAGAAPPTRPWKGKLKVATIYRETPAVKTFRLIPPDGGDLPFTYLAGQFVTLSVVVNDKPLKRSYSISSHPCDRKMIELTIKREENGLVSRYMHDVIHEGDLLDLDAAFGKLTFSGVGGDGIVLLGGGVGITPLMSVLRCLISCGMKNDIHLVYACKSLDDFVYREELRQLQVRNPNFKILVAVHTLVGEFPGAYQGRLTKEKILEAVPHISTARIHICGPPSLMESMRAILTELKVPDEQIKTEAFASAKPAAPTAAPPKTEPPKADASAEKKPTADPAAVTPEAAPADAPPVNAASATTGKQVTFTKSGKKLEIGAQETVLELSETSGIDIPYVCRVGTCGTCKVPLISGEVTMAVQDALTEEDKTNKIILACQAIATTDLEVEEP